MNVSWNLKVVGWKKNHNFLLHYNQVGGRRNQQLPMSVLRHDWIFYYLINFHKHKSFYDFYNEKIVDDFLNSIYERFVSGGYYKIQGYGKIVNYQQTELVNLENDRVWSTNPYKDCHFNPYIWWEIKKDIVKSTNESTGSSWVFKRFNKYR